MDDQVMNFGFSHIYIMINIFTLPIGGHHRVFGGSKQVLVGAWNQQQLYFVDKFYDFVWDSSNQGIYDTSQLLCEELLQINAQ